MPAPFRLRPFLSLVLLGTALCAGSATAETCGLTRMASLPVERLPNGLMLVPVGINGQPAHLALDTGSAITSSLFQPALDRLGLHSTEMQQRLTMSSGQQINRMVMLKTLDIGDVHVEKTQFVAMPPDDDGGHADGLLGPDIIRQLDVEIDPLGNKVNLFSQKHCPGQVVYWTAQFIDLPMKVLRSGHLSIDVTLDDHPLHAVVDTGASTSVMSIQGVKRVFGLDTDAPGVTAVKPAGQDPAQPSGVYSTTFKSLSLGGIQIRNPHVTLIADQVRDSIDKAQLATPSLNDEAARLAEFTIGVDVLSKLRIYIAYGEQHLYASAAGAK